MIKLEGNGLWESSRIILPEHREALLEDMRAQKVRPRIQLDDQEMDRIREALSASYKHRVPLIIILYHPEEALRLEGKVNAIASLRGQFRVEDDWYHIDDVEGVEFCEEW